MATPPILQQITLLDTRDLARIEIQRFREPLV
jgi:hypothetical protein